MKKYHKSHNPNNASSNSYRAKFHNWQVLLPQKTINTFLRWIAIIILLTGFLVLYFIFYDRFIPPQSTNVDDRIIDNYDLVNLNQYVSKIDSAYFNKIFNNKNKLNSSFSGKFYLDIPSIDIVNARVEANVKSDEKIDYAKILDTNLAHFLGSSIPGDVGNVFIYGHSTNKKYFRTNHNNPVVEFTKLFDLKLGDTITIKIDKQIFKYIVTEMKQVSPDDISVLDLDNKTERKLTLMTCGFPPGDGTKRFVVIAKQLIEDL